MSMFSNNGSGGGISPEQLDALASDVDLSVVKAELLARLDTTSQSMPGEVRMFNNTTGTPPTGWTRTNQNLALSAAWSGSARLAVLPFRNAASGGIAPAASGLQSVLTAISEAHNKLFYFSGNLSGGRPVSLWDLTTFNWQATANIPTTSYIGAMAVAGDYVYIAGGYATLAAHNSVYRYNITAGTFTSLTRPVAPSRDWALLPLPDGRVVMTGGCTSTGVPTATNLLATTNLYNPATGTWSTRAPAPLSFANAKSARMGASKFLLLVATTSDGTTLYNATPTLLLYDAAADTWAIVTEALPAGYSGLVSLSATPDGRALLTCSTSPAGASAGLVYDPAAPVGSAIAPFDLGDNDLVKFLTPTYAYGSCMTSYAGCAYLPVYGQGAGLYAPALIHIGPDVPVTRNFYAIKN